MRIGLSSYSLDREIKDWHNCLTGEIRKGIGDLPGVNIIKLITSHHLLPKNEATHRIPDKDNRARRLPRFPRHRL